MTIAKVDIIEDVAETVVGTRSFTGTITLSFSAVIKDTFLQDMRADAQLTEDLYAETVVDDELKQVLVRAKATPFLLEAQRKYPYDDDAFLGMILRHGVRNCATSGIARLFRQSEFTGRVTTLGVKATPYKGKNVIVR